MSHTSYNNGCNTVANKFENFFHLSSSGKQKFFTDITARNQTISRRFDALATLFINALGNGTPLKKEAEEKEAVNKFDSDRVSSFGSDPSDYAVTPPEFSFAEISEQLEKRDYPWYLFPFKISRWVVTTIFPFKTNYQATLGELDTVFNNCIQTKVLPLDDQLSNLHCRLDKYSAEESDIRRERWLIEEARIAKSSDEKSSDEKSLEEREKELEERIENFDQRIQNLYREFDQDQFGADNKLEKTLESFLTVSSISSSNKEKVKQLLAKFKEVCRRMRAVQSKNYFALGVVGKKQGILPVALPKGITNEGDTCFLAASLQVINHLKFYRDYVNSIEQKKDVEAEALGKAQRASEVQETVQDVAQETLQKSKISPIYSKLVDEANEIDSASDSSEEEHSVGLAGKVSFKKDYIYPFIEHFKNILSYFSFATTSVTTSNEKFTLKKLQAGSFTNEKEASLTKKELEEAAKAAKIKKQKQDQGALEKQQRFYMEALKYHLPKFLRKISSSQGGGAAALKGINNLRRLAFKAGMVKKKSGQDDGTEVIGQILNKLGLDLPIVLAPSMLSGFEFSPFNIMTNLVSGAPSRNFYDFYDGYLQKMTEKLMKNRVQSLPPVVSFTFGHCQYNDPGEEFDAEAFSDNRTPVEMPLSVAPYGQLGPDYRLEAVMVHVGSIESGHYTALLRNKDGDGFTLVSDGQVQSLSADSPLIHTLLSKGVKFFYSRGVVA